MKGILSILLWAITFTCFGQLKHDANWVFGHNAGLDFTDPDTVLPKTYVCETWEIAASFSDIQGNLICYLSRDSVIGGLSTPMNLLNKNGQVLINGDGIAAYASCTRGGVFLPVPGNEKNEVVLVSSGKQSIDCPISTCNRLFATYIDYSDSIAVRVTQKNQPLSQEIVDERIFAVKHANGKDWWIYTHLRGDENNGIPCNNTYLRFLLNQDGVSFSDLQEIGSSFCNSNSYIGGGGVSKSGKLLTTCNLGHNIIDVFYIDRCSGQLQTKAQSMLLYTPYMAAISQNDSFLYVTSNEPVTGFSLLTQFDLYQNTIDSTKFDLFVDSLNATNTMGIGPDSKIYMSMGYSSFLSVIEQPNNAGFSSHFSLNSIALASGTYSALSLPQMPNYNLGPLPIYQASAGEDTFYCAGDSTIKALPIGGDSIYGITYLWQPAPGIDSLTARTQLVLPTQSRWYYVTLTDTNYIGPSCNSRLDSVFVEVRTCTGITEPQALQAKLYPNPTNGLLTVELANGHGGNFKLFNLLGQQVFEQSLEHDKSTFNLDLPKGIYLYQITAQGKVVNGKLVLGE